MQNRKEKSRKLYNQDIGASEKKEQKHLRENIF